MTDGTAAAQKEYLDPQVLARVSRLDLRARLAVQGFISGMHRSPYHGYSVEFAEHREYVPGDDTKHIDWKVWGRANRFYLKQYEEETNLACTILLDCSRSMRYGEDGGGWSKFDYACTLTAVLAMLLQRQQDAPGLITFDRAVRRQLAPSAHPRHLNALIHELESCEPDHASDVDDVFTHLPGHLSRRGMAVIVSDLFLDLGALKKLLQQLRSRKQEVLVFHLLHSDEVTFPFADNTLFRGLETETELMAEPPALRKAYLAALEDYCREVRRICSGARADYVFFDTGSHLDTPLSAYLASRRKRRSAGG